ncbi:hypothetical protein RRG08_019285 [Elysia crispata]|uniref:Cornifelin n=1 Tax=Elysia crispata TaxID=231223 RepID=A0AAE1D176_9GAST|nr:hypothetical protein RRG08_019285 [Elysia crispata]
MFGSHRISYIFENLCLFSIDQKSTKENMSELQAGGRNEPIVAAQPMQNTTVIIQQPQPQVWQRDWSTGMFSCFDDIPICLLGYFCGLCLACKVSSDMDESVCVPICLPLPVSILRTKWRTQQNIMGSIMDDCVMTTFCGPCTLCQLAREVQSVKRQG